MRIFILDDLESRHVAFRRQYAGHEIVSAYTYMEATDLLKEGPYDIAQLDHNLGTVDDGCTAVRFILTLPEELRPKRVYVHTHNNYCGPLMAEELRRAGIPAKYLPFRV